mmetsp:Transcript_5529/g.10158  ORF Transcript_5529/g.10158 Transcript_5529/m.10158 type:complete len:227 (+) Transcript_5529:411-1091(+)
MLATRLHRQAVAIHQLGELLAHVLGTAESSSLEVVLVAPGVRELVVSPGLVHSEEGEVVALWLEKLGFFHVGLGLFLFGSVEDVLDRKHADDREHLLRAAQFCAFDQNLRQLGLERELGHLAPEAGQQPFIVEGAQRVQRLERRHHGLNGRRVHKVEAKHVVDSHRFESKHDVAEVRALDLGRIGGKHFVLERLLRVKAEALSGTSAAGAARTLVGGGLGDRGDYE